MRDDLPFFSHDNDARNHAKMKALRSRYGWTGYGQFWALNEMIADSAGARLDLSRKVVRASAACELGMTPDAFDDFLKFLSDRDECGLIHYDEGIVTTDRTQEDYEKVVSSRDQRSSAGKASAEKRWKKSTPVTESVTAVIENDNGRSTVVQRPVTKYSQHFQQNRIERGEENRETEERASAPVGVGSFEEFLQLFTQTWNDAGCTPRFTVTMSTNLTTDEREKMSKASARIKDFPRAIKAIQNYGGIQKSADHEAKPSGFYLPGFLLTGVEVYADDAKPWEKMRKKVATLQPEKKPSVEVPDAEETAEYLRRMRESGRPEETTADASAMMDEWAKANPNNPLARRMQKPKDEDESFADDPDSEAFGDEAVG